MPEKQAPRSTFSARTLNLLLESRMLGIRAGADHKFTGIWFVVVGNRLFARPWNDKPTGWHRTLLREGRGAILVSNREIPIRARRSRSEGLFDAVDAAYAAKYDTKASQKWVRGFKLRSRRLTTTELLPAERRASS
jgi:hypothetical protein